MDVARLCPLAVGIVRWMSPRPTCTAIVKATFPLRDEGHPRLHDRPEGLHRDSRGEIGNEEELERSSDFAPRKARADVVLVGHAQSGGEAHPAWPIRVRVGVLDKRLFAIGAQPAAIVPLLSSSLRLEPRRDSQPVRVAPSPQRVPGWISRAVQENFDFARFNVAPVDQQLSEIRPGERLELHGVLRDGPLERALPDLVPCVHYVALPAGRARALRLRCDTLWIHTDLGLLTMTWRGEVDAPEAEGYLVVDAAYGAAPSWSSTSRRIESAEWVRAVEEGDVVISERAPTVSASEQAPGSERTLTIAGGRGAPPSSDAQWEDGPTLVRRGESVEEDAPDTEPAGLRTESATPFDPSAELPLGLGARLAALSSSSSADTLIVEEDPPQAEAPLPFRPPVEGWPSEREAFESPRARTGTLLAEERPSSPPLPFSRPPSDAPPNSAATRLLDTPVGAGSTASEPALPFHHSSSPPPSPVASGRERTATLDLAGDAGAALRGSRPLPFAAPNAPRENPAAGSNRSARDDSGDGDLLPLETYAAIKVAVLRGSPLAEALAEHGLDEITWRVEERRRIQHISHAADRGDLVPIRALRKAMREAQLRAKR